MSDVKKELTKWIENHFTGPKEIIETDLWLVIFNVIAISTTVKIIDNKGMGVGIEMLADLENVAKVVEDIIKDKDIIKLSDWKEKEVNMLEIMGILEKEEEDEHVNLGSNDGRYH